ncbi:MAG: hypothetical protein KAS32_28160 [Candidatus Peribacteraceae bacterium]|nr:hypothetical protein [Candidatus Peribacteraceae bacterium]
MEIEISFVENRNEEVRYEADIKDLPGTPYVGKGSTPELAVARAFLFNIKGTGVRFDFTALDWEIKITKKGY